MSTSLERMVERTLSRYSAPPPEREYRVGRYRLDFAWPRVLIAIEADGWHHRSPEGAAGDRRRDSWLRSQGWVVFRVDDEHGERVLAHQIMRAVRLVNHDLSSGYRSWAPPEPESVFEAHARLSPGDRI